MQVAARSLIAEAVLKEGDSLALAPCGKELEPKPEKLIDIDIAKVIIQEKLTKQNLKAFGFQTFEQMEVSDFREFVRQKKDAFTRSLNAAETDRFEKLKTGI